MTKYKLIVGLVVPNTNQKSVHIWNCSTMHLVVTMVYVCDKCRFLFWRIGPVDACPDCGSPLIREANAAEKDEFHRHQAETGGDEDYEK